MSSRWVHRNRWGVIRGTSHPYEQPRLGIPWLLCVIGVLLIILSLDTYGPVDRLKLYGGLGCILLAAIILMRRGIRALRDVQPLWDPDEVPPDDRPQAYWSNRR